MEEEREESNTGIQERMDGEIMEKYGGNGEQRRNPKIFPSFLSYTAEDRNMRKIKTEKSVTENYRSERVK